MKYKFVKVSNYFNSVEKETKTLYTVDITPTGGRKGREQRRAANGGSNAIIK